MNKKTKKKQRIYWYARHDETPGIRVDFNDVKRLKRVRRGQFTTYDFFFFVFVRNCINRIVRGKK